MHADLAIRLNASADKVWATLTGADMVRLLVETYATTVEAEAGGPAAGAVFVTTLRAGGVVRERVESIDHEERSFKYRVLDAGPLPYANYRGEARVQPCGENACVLSFQASFIAVETSQVEALHRWTEHNREVMAAVKKFVEI